MRTWMRFALAALLAMPFTLASIRADDPELKETTEQKVQRLDRELKQLHKDLDDLRNDVRDNSLRRNASSADLRDVRRRLDLLEQIVRRHTELMETSITRQSAYGPGGQPAPGGAAAPSVTTVTIRNQYPTTPITVRLNGQIYMVEPNRTMTVTGVPVGPLTYEVSVENYRLQPTTVTLSPAGRNINVYPLQP